MEENSVKKFDLRFLFWSKLPLFVLAHFSHHVLTALAVPLLPFIRNEFGLDYTRSGFVISAFSLSYGISQIPGGWLADRLGPIILIGISISGVALAGLFVGLSHTYLMMLMLLILMGVLGGGYHPAAPPLISTFVEPQNRGRALGIHMIGGSTSHFLAPIIGVGIAASWGWRGAYIGLAAPSIIFGIIFFFIFRESREKWRENYKVKKRQQGTADFSTSLRPLIAFIVLSAFNGATIIAAVTFIPLFMVDHFGVSKETAAAFLSIVYSAGFWAGILGGYLSDRLGKVQVMLTACFISAPMIYLLNLVPFGFGFGALLLVIGMILIMRMPISESYIVSQTSESNRSTILGIYYFSALEGGGVLTPVMGYLIDHFGFYASFSIAGAAILLVTLICSPFLFTNQQ